MKTKHFFIVSIFLFGIILKSNGQTNVVVATAQPDPGVQNVMVGVQVGTLTTTVGPPGSGQDNTFMGYHSALVHTSGVRNTFLGSEAGAAITNEVDNTFIGARSGLQATGFTNTFIGSSAGRFSTGNGNSCIGFQAGMISSGQANVFFGEQAGILNGAGTNNVAIGINAGHGLGDTDPNNRFSYSNGSDNVFVGNGAGINIELGKYNTFIGNGAGAGSLTNTQGNPNPEGVRGSQNVFVGRNSGGLNRTGEANVYIGNTTGYNNNGIRNVFIGFEVGSLGSGINDRLMIDNSNTTDPLIDGDFYTENVTFNIDELPSSRVRINANGVHPTPGAGLSGLNFTKLNNAHDAIDNPTNKVLSVDANGDVILVNDKEGTTPPPNPALTNTCATLDFVTKSDGTNIGCSQIFDNYRPAHLIEVSGQNIMMPSNINKKGTGVAIGYETNPGNVWSVNYMSSFYTNYSGANAQEGSHLRLHINGNARALGIYQTSDQSYKINVEPIHNALNIIKRLNGKTYNWDVANYPDIDFDYGDHSGFIAQEIEQVIPHVVITDVDDSGELGKKSVNYTEVIPYLVEAIKEQLELIADLQNQIICINEKTSSGCIGSEMKVAVEAANFESTRILTVSPNPTRDKANVVFNLEKGVDTASLQLFDINGNVLSSFVIKERDNNLSRTFEKNNYGTGTYIVSLIINGKSIDSKKIIFE